MSQEASGFPLYSLGTKKGMVALGLWNEERLVEGLAFEMAVEGWEEF